MRGAGRSTLRRRQSCARLFLLLLTLLLLPVVGCKHAPASQPRPATKNAQAQPAAPAAAPAIKAPAVRVRGEGPRYAVQVAAFDRRESAEALAARLSEQFGLQTLVAPVESNGTTHYRVRLLVGSKDQADSVADTFLRKQNIKVWIVPL